MPGHARVQGFYYADATHALEQLAARMRENSERWFPEMHAPGAIPPWILWSMGVASEGGEQLDETKKVLRTGSTDPANRLEKLAEELGDVFTYLLLVADDLGIDLVREWLKKSEINEARFGRKEPPPTLGEACLQVVREAGHPLSNLEVKQELDRRGWFPLCTVIDVANEHDRLV